MNAAAVSLAVIVAVALLFVALERVRPYDRGQRLFRPGFWTDLVAYGIVQSWLLGVVIGAFLTAFPPGRIAGTWPLWAQVAFFVVTHDLYIYWFHRAQHRSPLLWRLHAAHHSTRDVDWLSGTRSHALEIVVNQTIEFAPIVLLGADPEVAAIKGAISACWGMFIHSNLDVRLGRLRWLINGPELHRWHHSIDEADGNRHFGTKLAIWDHLFGTARAPAGKPRGYGLGEGELPTTFAGQLVAPFRRSVTRAR